jgi:hypothetical protein
VHIQSTWLTSISAITAVYKGSTKGVAPAILRSYDSRKETPLEYDCKIWEAGRATCAIGLAFKPIQIGQSVFHDDGAGTFNPAPEALDEAVVNEWPGREVGVFVSVGTGRRPKGSDANQSMWYEGFLGEFAEARKRLISKIEGCEKIHEFMVKEYLGKRNVNVENYYRFNVEIGVGEFGMNEWNRLADISGGTRRYLARHEEQRMIQDASAKLARIHRAVFRYSRLPNVPELTKSSSNTLPLAVELPGDLPTWPPHSTSPSRSSYESGQDQLTVPTGNTPSPRSSAERIRPATGNSQGSSPGPHRPAQPLPSSANTRSTDDPDRLVVNAPTPAQYRYAAGADKIAIMTQDEHPRRQQQPQTGPQRIEPPPLPPKTPLPEHQNQIGGVRRPAPASSSSSSGVALPYPLDEEAPPPVNMARKPDYRGR